jgi:peroxiredoxin
MNPTRSTITRRADSQHPLDSAAVKKNLQQFQASMEKVRNMKPVTVYVVSWNLPDKDTEYYSTQKEAEWNYSEHHSIITEHKAVRDEDGNIFLVFVKATVKTQKIEVCQNDESRRELEKIKKRKRIVDEELAGVYELAHGI